MKNVKLGAVALVVALSAGCSVVKMSRVSPDWEGTDRHQVKRLLVLTAPYPAGDEKVAQMWSALAARHVDLKRNFIILEKSAATVRRDRDPPFAFAGSVPPEMPQ